MGHGPWQFFKLCDPLSVPKRHDIDPLRPSDASTLGKPSATGLRGQGEHAMGLDDGAQAPSPRPQASKQASKKNPGGKFGSASERDGGAPLCLFDDLLGAGLAAVRSNFAAPSN